MTQTDQTNEPRVTVVGAGSWGTAVASMIAPETPTTIWARREDVAREIATAHTNESYLPGLGLAPNL